MLELEVNFILNVKHFYNSIFFSILDILRVKKDELFPADLLTISSSFEDGQCYVETSNLDG